MINPKKITNYNLTDDELAKHLIFWILAAGHSGLGAARKTEQIINTAHRHFIEEHNTIGPTNPFKLLSQIDLDAVLVDARSFNPDRISRTIRELIAEDFNLKTCEREELIQVFGIGMKSASCYIIHSRRNVRMAGLDRHILSFLRNHGVDAPNNTPTKKRYLELEEVFLQICDKEGRNPAEFDLSLWNQKGRV